MNKYELTVVLSASLDEEARSAAMEKVQGYITRFGGNVLEAKALEKRTLAYEIQKMTEAFYSLITFEAPLDAPAQIENRVRIMEQVVRFLIVKQEEK